jgi:hypothetical protein
MKTRVSLVVATLMLAPAVSFAAPAQQDAASTPAANGAKALDPNEMICERQQEPGSRLAAAKVCHTRAEWADLRAQDRQDLEKAQTQRGTMAPH